MYVLYLHSLRTHCDALNTQTDDKLSLSSGSWRTRILWCDWTYCRRFFRETKLFFRPSSSSSSPSSSPLQHEHEHKHKLAVSWVYFAFVSIRGRKLRSSWRLRLTAATSGSCFFFVGVCVDSVTPPPADGKWRCRMACLVFRTALNYRKLDFTQL